MKTSIRGLRPRRALPALAGIAALALLAASPAGATAGPGAYGERVDLTVATLPFVPPANVESGPLPEVHAPVTGTASNSAASATVEDYLTTGLLNVESNQGFSKASVNETSVLDGRLTADVVSAECTGPLGRTTLAGVMLDGDPVLDLNPHPNTVLLDEGGVRIVLNRQFESGSDFVVRAIEITFTDAPIGTGVVNGIIVISEARCNKAAPIPAGAIGGLGLAGLVAVLFVGQQVISRRRRSTALTSEA